ncbi:hypothetical protein TSACC_23217 [Terrimicrobium sacchariphilum]|uniref:3-methyladenine DNA glycosylase n=1 Tax=Terrimicrobium sacchariphilum TaxID=690879 RepID=A0A146GC59_TERSA|nr:3-methyladenine DNA glycosylase [Terrimicrobium sacchariphilum]GAT34783.1 hypothetical protein TSACC_23217 [Terrimicrobium sacchariphilum]
MKSALILNAPAWRQMRRDHEARVRPWIEPRLRRMSLQQKHPVDDFLFEYYPNRPAKLLLWHPGLGVVLRGEGCEEYLAITGYRREGDGVMVDPAELPEKRRTFPRWLAGFLMAAANRPAVFGCFGLHEWAMVYRTQETRHSWPLRVSGDELASAVESLGLRCTHYDAFRFFTTEAVPLNKHSLTRETTIDFEQPGCLHANMDLYKWAFKLAPFSSSELVADCFELARDIRTLDMQASPYDLRELGYEPVRVETPEGRAEYESRQRDFSRRAAPLRENLIALCQELIAPGVEVG